ncbi:putative HTH-type transcriptional regulator [mine drainage metagenome]|uniref:Putative HTH-type transcriptional regulator n=1 Tax=mine drainage metagenome TaxID=410659 RepID=A0A1J5S3G7_9ZZZZ
MTKRQLFDEFARIGQALGSGARIELLDLLFQAERTVDELAKETGMSVANVSQHLQVLRRARMVEVRREGLHAHYRLAGDEVYQIWSAMRSFGERRVHEVRAALDEFLTTRENVEAVSATDLVRRLKAGQVTVIDVRPAEEYRAGHIAGAISLPMSQLASQLGRLPRRREIVAYCRGPYCVHSDAAVSLLEKHGFKAKRLEFGLPEWRARGLSVASGPE